MKFLCSVGVFVMCACAAFAQAAPASSAADPPAVSTFPDEPISKHERSRWFIHSTVGPLSLGGGLFSAAIGTARNQPEEYGPHWGGFGSRYGMRLTGVATSNAMEATLGSFWQEDPRYFRAGPGTSFKGRIGHVVVMTFAARRGNGALGPAYARWIAVPGSNFLSNTWRADSEANNHDAALRTMWGFLGRMGGNAFREFWPSVSKRVFHHQRD